MVKVKMKSVVKKNLSAKRVVVIKMSEKTARKLRDELGVTPFGDGGIFWKVYTPLRDALATGGI